MACQSCIFYAYYLPQPALYNLLNTTALYSLQKHKHGCHKKRICECSYSGKYFCHFKSVVTTHDQLVSYFSSLYSKQREFYSFVLWTVFVLPPNVYGFQLITYCMSKRFILTMNYRQWLLLTGRCEQYYHEHSLDILSHLLQCSSSVVDLIPIQGYNLSL